MRISALPKKGRAQALNLVMGDTAVGIDLVTKSERNGAFARASVVFFFSRRWSSEIPLMPMAVRVRGVEFISKSSGASGNGSPNLVKSQLTRGPSPGTEFQGPTGGAGGSAPMSPARIRPHHSTTTDAWYHHIFSWHDLWSGSLLHTVSNTVKIEGEDLGAPVVRFASSCCADSTPAEKGR